MCGRSMTCSGAPPRRSRSELSAGAGRGVPLLMRFAALLASVLVLHAGESPDARAQAKALWLEAAKASDVWTCLQLEAWGRDQQPALRLNQILEGSTVFGEPLFAFPGHVRSMHDLGSRVVVLTDHRVHVLASDGRPLQRSQVLVPASEYQDLNWDGTVVATVQGSRAGIDVPQQVHLGSVRVSDGTRLLETHWTLKIGQRWDGRLSVSSEGSAIAVPIFSSQAALGSPRALWIARPKSDPEIIANAWSPIVLGPQGAWVMAYIEKTQALIKGEQRTPISWPTAGPGGFAACFIAGKPHLVKPDGSVKTLDSGVGLGDGRRLESVGGYLVLGSGLGAKVVSEGDLLGENAGVEVVQPETVALWRWSDLLNDPAARPVATYVSPLSRARQHASALWLWDGVGNGVDILDLGGEAPARSRYLDAAAPVKWVWTSAFATVVDHGDGRRVLYDPAKREIWSGTCASVAVQRRNLALVGLEGTDGPRWQLHRLSQQAAERSLVDLALPRRELDIKVGYRIHDYVVGRAEAQWWRVGIDGKLIDHGPDEGPNGEELQPLAWGCADPPGRWFQDGARVFSKEYGRPSELAARLDLQDAWRFGPTTVLLEQDRQVLASGRKRGEWQDLGRVPEADGFALAGEAAVLAGGVPRQAVRGIVAGPRLSEVRSAATQEMPNGPWRLEADGRFIVPKGRQYRWDGERVGFWPVRLRSPESSGLLVVARSLLIELTAEGAKAIGR